MRTVDGRFFLMEENLKIVDSRLFSTPKMVKGVGEGIFWLEEGSDVLVAGLIWKNRKRLQNSGKTPYLSGNDRAAV